MTTNDSIALACSLWPAWKPTREQLAEWRSALSSFPSSVAHDAVRIAYRQSRWKEPRLSNVIDHANSISSARTDEARLELAERIRIREEADRRESDTGHAVMVRDLNEHPASVRIPALDRAAEAWGAPHWRELSERPVHEWPRMAVGMCWAAAKEAGR